MCDTERVSRSFLDDAQRNADDVVQVVPEHRLVSLSFAAYRATLEQTARATLATGKDMCEVIRAIQRLDLDVPARSWLT